MAKRYPDDLRNQIIAFVKDGNSMRAAAREFDVSPSFAVKLLHGDLVSDRKAATVAGAKASAVSSAPRTEEISGADLADILGVSKRSISDFAVRGIIQRIGWNRFHERQSIKLYCDHLRTVAAGRGGDSTSELTTERARLAREQADSQALKNATQRGLMVPSAEVERGWSTICRRVRNAMLAIPSRVRQSLPHLNAYDAGVIDREVRDALVELGTDDGNRETDRGGVDQHGPASEDETVGVDRA